MTKYTEKEFIENLKKGEEFPIKKEQFSDEVIGFIKKYNCRMLGEGISVRSNEYVYLVSPN